MLCSDTLCIFFFLEKLIVLLRDGRKLLGTLCSFDQFGTVYPHIFTYFPAIRSSFNVYFAANVVLQGACERVIVGELYCDVPLGLYVIRGENVVLIGELVIIAVTL
jgi:U6 snRNA-associated Sm-like protein LSm1